MFHGVMPLRHQFGRPSAPGPLVLAVVVFCLVASALPDGAAVAAARAQTADVQDRTAGVASAADTRARRIARLRASVRMLREAADATVRDPANPIHRIGFTLQADLLGELIRLERKAGGIGPQVALAQRVLDSEIRRVNAAWRAADAGPQVAAMVRQLDALTRDAAKASGKRTNAEINAFKASHLAEIKYAGRRWIVDRAVGRQGAVIISRGVRNARLRHTIEQLYRYGAKTGDGGTADALIAEVKAGCRGGACKHFLKAGERRAQLLRILSEERLSVTERQIAGELIGALTKAIRVAGGK
jgi:hypothetical protein